MTQDQMYDAADSILAQKLSQIEGVGQVFVWGIIAAGGAHRGQSQPAEQLNVGLETLRTAVGGAERQPGRRACSRTATRAGSSVPTTSS